MFPPAQSKPPAFHRLRRDLATKHAAARARRPREDCRGSFPEPKEEDSQEDAEVDNWPDWSVKEESAQVAPEWQAVPRAQEAQKPPEPKEPPKSKSKTEDEDLVAEAVFFSPQGYKIIWVEENQAKLMLTMPGFTSFHVSRLIGKKGCVLLEIGRKSGTRVWLCGHDSNRPTDEPNHLQVNGRAASDVERGLQVACEAVENVLEIDFPMCAHCGGDHKTRDCFKMRMPYVHKRFLEPGTNVGFIVGSGGRNIKPILEETGASIRMQGVGSGQHNATESLHMRIESLSQESLDRAIKMVEALICRVANWSPYEDDPPEGHAFAYQHKIWLHMEAARHSYDSLNAHLLGKGGQNLRRIHEATGSWLWLRGNGSGFASNGEELHLLIEDDDAENGEKALQMATELLDTVMRQLDNTFCRICGGPHFTYRCNKANSPGYLGEMAAKGAKGHGKRKWH
mmetsp:Transcript_57581/g.134935  ORF Transcript_57581/g.134935 Transcript_57581/m.134935 type:complete len:453 (+) Transcript_57581:22-1380(+)